MAHVGTVGTADGQAASVASLGQRAEAYARERGISRTTLEQLGVVSATVFFPELKGSSEAIIFQYFAGGKRTFWKGRAFPDKAFVAQKGGEVAFYNLENVLADIPETVFITEGEFDCAALVEAGIGLNQVLSVPTGAPEKPIPDDEPISGYGFVDDALKAGLSRVKRFVWCGDGDANGLALRQNMARIFGFARFWFVDWPEGIKDPNQMLMTDGPEDLRDLVVNGCRPWPVQGVYRISEIPEPPPLTLWTPGFVEWEGKVKLAPGTMSVVTGHPGHGKTALWAQIWFSIVRKYGVGACMATFETRPVPHMRRTLRTLFWGKLECDMSPEEKARADYWVDDRYRWIIHPDQKPTLGWLLDMAEVAVIRHGARIVQIDPWNRLESQRGQNETETDYIGRCLTSLYVFAQQMNVHVQVLAHPSKMDGPRKGKAPELDDIAGSKHWDNRVDQGFVVHRPKLFEGGQRCTDAELLYKKSRFEELGYPCKLLMRFDTARRTYVSVDYEA